MARGARSPRSRRANRRREGLPASLRLPWTEGTPRFMVCAVAEVAIRREGPVLWITLHRPEALNALDAPTYAGLAIALEEAAAPEVRAVVLTGAGRAFCAGQDLNELRGPTYGIA